MVGGDNNTLADLGKRFHDLGGHDDLVTLLGEISGKLGAQGTTGPVIADPADGWVDLDLATALSSAAPLADDEKRHWWRTTLDTAPTILVFVPILLTWLALFAASHAYQELESNAAARAANAGKSFLELWQQGFDGRLWAGLGFGNVALYTVATISLIIITTAAGAYLRRRDDERAQISRSKSDRARAALLPRLLKAQAELNRRRLGSPARFGTELSKAADGLRQLLEHTSQTQNNAEGLVRQNQRLAVELGGYVTQMRQACEALQSATRLMNTASDSLTVANTALATEITSRLTASSDRLDQVSGTAARRVDALIRAGESSLDGITERFETAMTALAVQVETTTTALSQAGLRYADAIAESSGNAAAEIGQTYQIAVEAAAMKLAVEMNRSAGELRLVLDGLGRIADTHLAAAQQTELAAKAHASAVAANAESLSGAALTIAGAADNITGAAGNISGAVQSFTGSAETVSAAADTMSEAAEGISGTAQAMSDTASTMSGAALSISDTAAGVSGTSGVLERAVDNYALIHREAAESLSAAATRLAAHTAVFADQLVAANAGRELEAEESVTPEELS